MKKNGKFMGNQPGKDKSCAFCHNAKHQGYLSPKMVKAHKCTAKSCPYLEKFEQHPYWVKKAEIKELKKQRKEEMKTADSVA